MEKEQMTVVVKGMTCGHCKAMVEKQLGKLPGVEAVTADLATGETVITGHVDRAVIREVVDDLGFTLAE